MRKSLLVLFVVHGLVLSACSKFEAVNRAVLPSPEAMPNGTEDGSAVPPEFSPAEITKIYQGVGQKLNAVVLQCPEKVWPNYSWKNMNVLMVGKDAPSLIWKGSTGTMEPLAEADIPAGARNGVYSFSTVKGQDMVSLFISGPSSGVFNEHRLLQLLVHEGFHFLGQRGWNSKGGRRGTAVPVLSEPRIYRRLLADRLRTYFLSGGKDQKALGQAAFWFEKWRSQFPEEVKSTTDGYEGTAFYVQTLSPIVTELGCESSDQALLEAAIPEIAKDHLVRLDEKTLRLDSEGYGVGGLSALILRLIDKNPNWYSLVKESQTPTEILLKNVEPVSDSIEGALQTAYDTAAAAENKFLEEMFGNDLKRFSQPETIRIVIPKSAVRASYSPKGFFLPQSKPGVMVSPLARAFTFEGDSWELKASADENLFSATSPCENGEFIALSSAAESTSTETEVRVASPSLTGKIEGHWTKDSSGLNWFCGK